MSTDEAIRKRIQDLCTVHNMTPHKLAMESGLPPSTLKSIMCGDSKNPKLLTIGIICDGLNISMREFFDCDYFDEIDQIIV